jgi:hypothetical protein
MLKRGTSFVIIEKRHFAKTGLKGRENGAISCILGGIIETSNK